MLGLLDRLVLAAAGVALAVRHPLLVLRLLRSRPWRERRWPRLGTPRTVDEKFLWRKVFDHDPLLVTLSDKLACKAWVEGLGLGLPIAPVRWSGEDARDIPAEVLARDVVVKANHGYATNLFPRRERLSRDEVVRRANAFLRVEHGRREHQWAYLPIRRRLFAEDLVGRPGQPLAELKLYAFGSHVLRAVHISDRFGAMAATRWEPGPDGRPVRDAAPSSVSDRVLDDPLPPTFPRALAVAQAIGAGFDHVRVDVLTDGEGLWLGEITVYNLTGWMPDCGHLPGAPMALAWDLRRSWFLRAPQANPALRLYAAALRRRLDREAPAKPPPVPMRAPDDRAGGLAGLPQPASR